MTRLVVLVANLRRRPWCAIRRRFRVSREDALALRRTPTSLHRRVAINDPRSFFGLHRGVNCHQLATLVSSHSHFLLTGPFIRHNLAAVASHRLLLKVEFLDENCLGRAPIIAFMLVLRVRGLTTAEFLGGRASNLRSVLNLGWQDIVVQP